MIEMRSALVHPGGRLSNDDVRIISFIKLLRLRVKEKITRIYLNLLIIFKKIDKFQDSNN
jgi:hypothetical protein